MISKACFWTGLITSVGVLAAHALETDRAYGEASYQFLKLPLSPRIAALGGAGTALWDGAGEAESNPAASALDGSRLVVGYGMPFGEFGAKASHVAWNIPWGGSRIWLGARYLGFDAIAGHDELGNATTDYGAHTLKIQGGYAASWRELQLGLALGYAQNNVAEATYSTGLFSLGAHYDLWRGLSIGASAINADIGAGKFRDSDYRTPFPPTTLQAGLAWAQVFGEYSAAIAADARTRNDEEMNFPVGLEITWNRLATARVGFPFGAQEPGLTAGFGLAWSRLQLQYAYVGHETLSGGHFLSLEIGY